MNNPAPLISLIIPTFNSEKVIKRCLESVINQNNKFHEIIIQDGASTDATAAIVEKYCSCHSFIHFYSSRDLGIYDAMNRAILKANGAWLIFLGSDDFLVDSNIISEVAEIILSNPNAHMIYGNVLSKSLGRKTRGIYGGKFDENRILRQNICHQAIFYKKAVLGNEPYNLRYRYYADYAVNLRLILDSNIIKISVPKVISNFTEGGFSSTVSEDVVFNKEFSTLVCQHANMNFHTYKHKFKFLTTFLHKVNKLEGLTESIRICQTNFRKFKFYTYPSILFVSLRYILGLYFMKKHQ